MAKEESTAAASVESQPKMGISIIMLIIPVLNTLALLGTLGVFYYSKLKYKRAPITEESERARLAKLSATPQAEAIAAYVDFEPVTVNIASTPDRPQTADASVKQMHGKLHYATVGFTLEIRDQTQQELVNAVRPLILDRLILLLGKKHYHELTTYQGRYILSTQILEYANQMISTAPENAGRAKEGLISHLFFTQFIVQ